MLTTGDIMKLKTIFIIKDDLQRMENRMIKKFNDVIDFFDDRVIDHERRIRSLETQNPITL